MMRKSRQLMFTATLCIAAMLAGVSCATPADEALMAEPDAIAALQGQADWLAKQAACRALRVNGTVKSIPALAALLPDEKLSHMARYALEPMPFPEAGQALRAALAKTEGLPKAGVIISLGARRDAEAVPLLIPLLKDPNADIARAAAGALGRIATPPAQEALMQFCGPPPVPSRETGQALREALAKTEGLSKVGVIISLGARRDVEAVPLLIPLLKDPDADIARTAAGALGRIATPQAQEALMQYRGDAPDSLRLAVADALLAIGERLPQEVKPETGSPDPPLYRELNWLRWPMFVRMGAFRGWAYADPKRTAAIVYVHLGGDEPVFRDMAAQIVAETSGEETTRFYAQALAKLFSADGRVALLRGLAGRGDPVARPAVVECVQKAERPVEIAAIRALAVLGNAEDVPLLVAALGSGDAERAAAAGSTLAALQAPDVNAALAASAPNAPPAVRAKILDLLADRRAGETIAVAAKGLADADVSVRVAALRELAPLAETEHVPAILQILVKTADATERAAAEKALSAVGSRVGESVLPPVLDAMNGATAETRIALLHVAARIGGPKALDTVVATLADANPQFSDEAVRLLAEWPTIDAAPHLLKLASSDDLTRQVLALRGYVRLAGVEPSTEEKARMLTAAMDLAKRPDEKKLVLGAWGTLPTEQSLDALCPHLDDAAVQNEAALAIMAISPELGKNASSKPKAIDALKSAIEKCADPSIRERGQKALAALQ